MGQGICIAILGQGGGGLGFGRTALFAEKVLEKVKKKHFYINFIFRSAANLGVRRRALHKKMNVARIFGNWEDNNSSRALINRKIHSCLTIIRGLAHFQLCK